MTRKRGRQKGKERRNLLVTITIKGQTLAEEGEPEEEMVAEVIIDVTEGIGREAMATTRYTKHILNSLTMPILLQIKCIKAILQIKCIKGILKTKCIKVILQIKCIKPLLLKISHMPNPLPTRMFLRTNNISNTSSSNTNRSNIISNSNISNSNSSSNNTSSHINNSSSTHTLMEYLLHHHLRKRKPNKLRKVIQFTMIIQHLKPHYKVYRIVVLYILTLIGRL
mmetsp:Transcript_31123/g.46937  ORF Transcript_31123/g.46937 Transcript_31123/m.46937 type:complete len:224 (-) Transcript_31123:16-687(-)